MNEDYFKEHAARVRTIASMADPFTKRRLLDLAERYDDRRALRRLTPLPSVTMGLQEHAGDQNSGGDPSETRG